MKKVLSIILVLFLGYNFAGYFYLYKIKQDQIREEIKENILYKIPVDQLILIKSFSGSCEKISWLEKNKEFRFKGCMYDVVKTKVIGDTTYYYCYNDIREARLFGNLNKLIKDHAGDSKSKSNNKKPVINYFFQQNCFTPSISEKPLHYFNLTPVLECIAPELLSPPPESCYI
jgi:hypothetical protein